MLALLIALVTPNVVALAYRTLRTTSVMAAAKQGAIRAVSPSRWAVSATGPTPESNEVSNGRLVVKAPCPELERSVAGAPATSQGGHGAGRSGERPHLRAHPSIGEAVGVRPAADLRRDHAHGNVERLDAPGQIVPVPVRVVLARRGQQDL